MQQALDAAADAKLQLSKAQEAAKSQTEELSVIKSDLRSKDDSFTNIMTMYNELRIKSEALQVENEHLSELESRDD